MYDYCTADRAASTVPATILRCRDKMADEAFHDHRRQWTRWAQVFARAAPDALRLVHLRDLGRSLVARIHRDKRDGVAQAMPLAGMAYHAFRCREAQVLVPDGTTDMDGLLLLRRKLPDGTGRAHVSAHRAFGSAVAMLKSHHRLHQSKRCARMARLQRP